MTLPTKTRTALALGLPNIARAAGYRLGVQLGLNPVRGLQAAVPDGPFFVATALELVEVDAPARVSWQSSASLFSHWPFAVSDGPPDWMANPLDGRRITAPHREWWKIPDFDPAFGDIKLVWELSRMDWVLAFAQRARQGDHRSLDRLNVWLADWCKHNPPYRGPNWKCGQEASIRVIHLATAALLLGQAVRSQQGLRDLVQLHLRRIAPTIQYAVAQDNNHGTSEAAALFIGGSWLQACGVDEGIHWARMGRRWLENRAARLIGAQGSFSQYSLNYHRLMLDTFSVTEVWRRHMGLPAFSDVWNARALAAAQWLRHMVNPLNGDGPNVGANDGARLLQLTETPYRDHRPSVQLAMALFSGDRAYPQEGQWDLPLKWLGVPLAQQAAAAPASYVADDGGFAMLRRGAAMAMLRYSRFRFRPSQCDVLHLDLWLSGENVLRDAGSFSYNTDAKWLEYFGGTESHNTGQFDGRDQMPRLSRFLLGDWLRTDRLEALKEDAAGVSFGAGYIDGRGARHHRRIRLTDQVLRIEDRVDGFVDKAVLRWRLAPGKWRLEGDAQAPQLAGIGRSGPTLLVRADMPIVRCQLVEGWESRHYLEKAAVPVLEVEVSQQGILTTEVRWAG